jgi:hypothetical protein
VSAWGAGPFENDDAMDLLDELGEVPPAELPARLSAALTLPADGAIQMSEACGAVAAAGLIAAACTGDIGGLDEEHVELARAEGVADARLRGLAVAALDRVGAGASEWRELCPSRKRRRRLTRRWPVFELRLPERADGLTVSAFRPLVVPRKRVVNGI